MHEPVGRVHFVVFEKFTSAYLSQSVREKSCDYLIYKDDATIFEIFMSCVSFAQHSRMFLVGSSYTKKITTTANFDSALAFS